ncbi:MAG TPA: multidrug ABC transporter ATP-binding protein [Spirochaetia bacterium]|nr:multidrug ABC transporter ATP-binding protein [Spirochaetia bacterium]
MHNLYRLRRFLKPYLSLTIAVMFLAGAGVIIELIMPKMVQQLVDKGIIVKNFYTIKQSVFIMLLLAALEMIINITRMFLGVRLMENIGRDLRNALFASVLRFSHANIDKLKTGSCITRITGDVAGLQRAVDVISFFTIRAFVLLFGSLFFMFTTGRYLALLLLPLLFMIVILILFFARRLMPLFLAVREALDRLNNMLQENLSGIRIIKSFVRQEYEEERFAGGNDNYTEKNLKALYAMSYLMPSVEMLISMAGAFILVFGGFQVIEAKLSIGAVFAFNNYLLIIARPVMMVAMMIGIISAAEASAGRVLEILDAEPAVKNPPVPLSAVITGNIFFKNIDFSYAGRGQALSDINLQIPAGSRIGIIGGTGSGKSTLAHLLPRFYDPQNGCILLDSNDIRLSSLAELRKKVIVVLQEPVLFSGTIGSNIAWAAPEAAEDAILQVSEISCLDEFIKSLPLGLDTPVSSRGSDLSGGQKQRIAIARALLCNPAILVLDDSTSSVDLQTEKTIETNIKAACRETTLLRIAQRISSVLSADIIFVLDNGKISGFGTHSSLLSQNPVYREIYYSQDGR